MSVPATPGTPLKTATPGTPLKTATPGTPLKTATPGTPLKTATPGTPLKTATPGTPLKTATPGTPLKTATSGTPLKPPTPGTPLKPPTPGTPLKRTFWNRSPSPIGMKTSKRRPLEDSVSPLSAKVQRKLDVMERESSFTDVGIYKNSHVDELTAKAIAKYGYKTLNCALSACKHVPENFIDRKFYITNIIKEVDQKVSTKDIQELMELGDLIDKELVSTESQFFKDLLVKLSMEKKEPYMNFLVPPVKECVNGNCDGSVYPCYKSVVTIYTLTGPEPGLKCCLRCADCLTRYHITMYSVPNVGRKFYPVELKGNLRSASNLTYFTHDTYELMCESSNHAFVSHKAFAAIYNGVFDEDHYQAKVFYKWQRRQKKNEFTVSDPVSRLQKQREDNLVSAEDEADESIDNHINGMTSKMALKCFFNNELESEIAERDLTSQTIISKGNTVEQVMSNVDTMRRNELYTHECCDNCKKKGCSNLRVIDACWKLNMFHCMMAVPQSVNGYPLLSFPNVCVSSPSPGSVFCKEHYDLLKRHKIPVLKEDFLRHVGCKANDSNAKMEEKVLMFAQKLADMDQRYCGTSAIKYQGTDGIVTQVDPCYWELEPKEETSTCNKDIGLKGKLRQRSRGHFVCVTGGGHIMYFNPLFKSESPSQVFVQTIKVIYEDVKDVPSDKLENHLKNYFLAYDNMCHLDTLKATKMDLPLPEPYRKLWTFIIKIIDSFHLPNHKNPKCKTKYNPDVLPPEYNTQAAEQTFSWMSRFKKIVNSMTQIHHLFYMHRMIKRRNVYTEKCRKNNVEPVLPLLKVPQSE